MSFFSSPFVSQLLVVVSSDWEKVEATLYRYERREETLPWERQGSPIPVVLGKNGMGWGRGVIDFTSFDGPSKKEGDGKSPAGFFYLGPAFGDLNYQNDHVSTIPFMLVTEDLEWVDDPNSAYYNRVVNTDSIESPDWVSSEKMKEVGPLYRLGLVVQHNLNPVEGGKGSAIFIHIWESENKGTHGCTAMSEGNLGEVVSWLRAEKSPCLVQMPIEEYRKRQALWELPEQI